MAGWLAGWLAGTARLGWDIRHMSTATLATEKQEEVAGGDRANILLHMGIYLCQWRTREGRVALACTLGQEMWLAVRGRGLPLCAVSVRKLEGFSYSWTVEVEGMELVGRALRYSLPGVPLDKRQCVVIGGITEAGWMNERGRDVSSRVGRSCNVVSGGLGR